MPKPHAEKPGPALKAATSEYVEHLVRHIAHMAKSDYRIKGMNFGADGDASHATLEWYSPKDGIERKMSINVTEGPNGPVVKVGWMAFKNGGKGIKYCEGRHSVDLIGAATGIELAFANANSITGKDMAVNAKGAAIRKTGTEDGSYRVPLSEK